MPTYEYVAPACKRWTPNCGHDPGPGCWYCGRPQSEHAEGSERVVTPTYEYVAGGAIDVTVDERLSRGCECGHSGAAHYDGLLNRLDVCRHCTCPEFSIADEPPVHVPTEFVGRFAGRPRACACGHYADAGVTIALDPADPDGDEIAVCSDCAAAVLRLSYTSGRRTPGALIDCSACGAGPGESCRPDCIPF
jgi:hypothetical protein